MRSLSSLLLLLSLILPSSLLPSLTPRLVEEVRDRTGVELENDDIYMNTVFEQFIRLVVVKSRGGGDTEFEFDAVRDRVFSVVFGLLGVSPRAQSIRGKG